MNRENLVSKHSVSYTPPILETEVLQTEGKKENNLFSRVRIQPTIVAVTDAHYVIATRWPQALIISFI